MKRIEWLVLVLVAALVLSLGAYAMAADAVKTVTGTSSCGGCTGVVGGCCLLLTDKDGARWVLKGDSESFKAAFKTRSAGKTMTGTIVGSPTTKKASDGGEYKEVKVSAVKIAS
jgi:hypothetical protein